MTRVTLDNRLGWVDDEGSATDLPHGRRHNMTMTDTTARHLDQGNAYAVHVHWRNGIHRRYTFDTLAGAFNFAVNLWGQRYDRPEPDGTSRLARVAAFWRGQPVWEADALAPHGAWVPKS